MQKISFLPQYNLILVRYNEIWLKSTKVKIRMLKTLMRNMKNMLNRAQIPFLKYQLSKDSTRIFYFFKNEYLAEVVAIFKKVFGIHSFSPALRTSSNIKNISEKAIEVAEQILKNGDTFALRVKRSGTHDYSSKDIARQVGQDIIDHFLNTNIQLKVNLTNPDKKIFIEVRRDFSYIFTDVIESDWGGLPIESNKKIAVMDVGRINDLLAGFLLMRRGSEIYPFLFDISQDDKLYNQWILNWKEITAFTPSFKFSIMRIKLYDILKNIINNKVKKEHVCGTCRVLRLKILSTLLSNSKEGALEGIRALTDGVSLTNSSICYDNIDLDSLSLNYLCSDFPIFTPIIGLDLTVIKEILSKISKNLTQIKYCPFRPKDQEVDVNELSKFLKSSETNRIITTCISKVERINII
ncbi:MAG: THUMP domain-containing protein [Promethearchaeota archaeon]